MTDNLLSLDHRVVVVAGAAGGGIGTTVTRMVAEAGATVIAVSRGKENLDDHIAPLIEQGLSIVPVAADVATELAVHRPGRALVLLSTFTSFPDMAQKQFPFFPGRWFVHTQMNNLSKIANVHCPVFVAHGTAVFIGLQTRSPMAFRDMIATVSGFNT